jgi:hypothetical protein
MFLWWESDEDHTYRDVDLQNPKHIDCIMKLCKRNKFYANDVFWFLHQNLPFDTFMGKQATFSWSQKTIDAVKRSKEAQIHWIPRGLFAMNGTKAVGFILYSIHRETKQELAVNFLLVDSMFRRHNRGSELLMVCEQRHAFNISYEEIGTSYYDQMVNIKTGEIEKSRELMDKIIQLQKQNKHDHQCNSLSDYELVDYITTTIKRDENFDKVVQFYKKNNFIDLNDKPNWRDICRQEEPSLLALVRVGPTTCASVSAQEA